MRIQTAFKGLSHTLQTDRGHLVCIVRPLVGALIFHTYVNSSHFFLVKNFEFQYFFGFSEK